MKIGVVCEGSHDFHTLSGVFRALSDKLGFQITAFEAVQPRVDATSGRQLGDGGWTRVKVWLEENCGAELRKILAPRIFAASETFDILVIHMDGDVLQHCNDFTAAERAYCFKNPARIVAKIEAYIEQILQPPDALDDDIIYAVPVLHTEAWLVAAAFTKKSNRDLECTPTKKLARRYLPWKYNDTMEEASRRAADAVGADLDGLSERIHSLQHFAAKVGARLG